MRTFTFAAALLAVCGCRGDQTEGSQTADLAAVADPALCPDGDCVVVTGTVVAVTPVLDEPVGLDPDSLCNGVDPNADRANNCLVDKDGDGHPQPLDCDDSNASKFRLAPEVFCDGIDQDCDGLDPCDSDKDGTLDSMDCEPKNPDVTTECLPSAVYEPLD